MLISYSVSKHCISKVFLHLISQNLIVAFCWTPLSAFKLSIPNPQPSYKFWKLEEGPSLVLGFRIEVLWWGYFVFQSLDIPKCIVRLVVGLFIKEKRNGKKTAEVHGLKFREASELENQGENEAKMTEKDSCEIQTSDLGSWGLLYQKDSNRDIPAIRKFW